MVEIEKSTETHHLVGTVSKSEIDDIMNGGELLRVTKEDLENLFGIASMRKKMAFSLAPIVNDSGIGLFFGWAVLATMVAAGFLFYAEFGKTLLAILGMVTILASSIGGLVAFVAASGMKKGYSALGMVFLGFAGIATACGVGYGLSELHQSQISDGSNFGIFASCVSIVMGVVGGICFWKYVSRVGEYAKQSLTLSFSMHEFRNRYYDTEDAIMKASTSYEQMYAYLKSNFSQRYSDVPDSVWMNLANQIHIQHPSNVGGFAYVSPKFDPDALKNEERRRKLAADPAIVLVKGNEMFLIGAWDIAGDAEKIAKAVSTSVKSSVDNVKRDIRERLSNNEVQRLLKAMKAKTNQTIASTK